jgi:iron(III) transport system permease protein
MPAMLYSWIWVALLAYRELTLAVVLSAGENTPLSAVVWSLVQTAQFGQASAVALIMVALMVPILLLYWTVARRTGIAPSS